jgi:hypothetical protein
MFGLDDSAEFDASGGRVGGVDELVTHEHARGQSAVCIQLLHARARERGQRGIRREAVEDRCGLERLRVVHIVVVGATHTSLGWEGAHLEP